MDADGYMFIVDRLKDKIISGGENIYCVEVDTAIGGKVLKTELRKPYWADRDRSMG